MTSPTIPAMPHTSPAPSGDQYVISHGDHRATIVAVGAMVREYTYQGKDVFVPFAADKPVPVFNAAILIPWPNRLSDGTYTANGTDYQLPITEPDRNNALHGLAARYRWDLVSHTDSAVALELALPAQPGWPFQLVSRVTYSLSDGGLTVDVATRNIGQGTAPYGIGFHPWLSTGGADLDQCTVRLDAATHVTVDDRLLPTGTVDVSGDKDLRVTRSLAGLDLDDAWIDPIRDADGLSWCTLGRPDG
ncbi:MAG: aldose epimerase, partial [Cellulomonadaceae bacterium]|nr:aldose epimerase [Cellulomonadaceae bacterium]